MNLQEFKSRLLKVSMSIPNMKGGAKITTMMIGGASDAGSPNMDIDPDGRSPSVEPNASQWGKHDQTHSSHHDRTIALLDVPDTVNDARIKAIMEKYGPLKRVQLRPDHGGAIIEFENAADVGKAELGATGLEILPGKKLRVGSVAELYKAKGNIHEPVLQKAQPIRRPGQSTTAARRGGKGGLGFRSAEDTNSASAATGAPKEGKSNADFRALINKK